MKWLDKIKEKFTSKKVEIKVGTRVRVDEEKALELLANHLIGMNWGTVVRVEKSIGGYLIKPDNCTLPDDSISGWVTKDEIIEAVNL